MDISQEALEESKRDQARQNICAQDVRAQEVATIHERAVLCCRMARLLHHILTGLDWPDLRFSDRSRLDRALSQPESDITLARSVVAAERPHSSFTHSGFRSTHSGFRSAGPRDAASTTKAASSGEA